MGQIHNFKNGNFRNGIRKHLVLIKSAIIRNEKQKNILKIIIEVEIPEAVVAEVEHY